MDFVFPSICILNWVLCLIESRQFITKQPIKIRICPFSNLFRCFRGLSLIP